MQTWLKAINGMPIIITEKTVNAQNIIAFVLSALSIISLESAPDSKKLTKKSSKYKVSSFAFNSGKEKAHTTAKTAPQKRAAVLMP